jgi:multidrug resistance efflux pump
MKNYQKYLVTGAIIAIAVTLVLLKYRDYVTNPWTRDGQVRANVIQIAPRVSGPIVDLPIRDNQSVKAGDLLFEIDPRTFQAALDQASAQLDQMGGNVAALEKQVDAARAGVAESQAAIEQSKSSIEEAAANITKYKLDYDRFQYLLEKEATSKMRVDHLKAKYDVSVQQKITAEAQLRQAQATLVESQASLAEAQAQLVSLGKSNPQIRGALAAVRQAELNLEFTKVKAPVDGNVTNLNLRLGSQAVANQPALALVDVSSYWVDGFFKETAIAPIRPGNRAIVTLMTYSDTAIEAHVDSIGWGIAQQDGSTGSELLPNVNPTFEWIRLAQRVPVRIHLTDVPKHIKLRVGTTCSVLVMTGTADPSRHKQVPPVPAPLQ